MKHYCEAISESVERMRGEAVSFLQELIRTPSLSGEEAEVATVAAEKMRAVGFDAVKIDRLQNVLATIKGINRGKSLLLNGHLDHVPAGDMVDPYSGKIVDGSSFCVKGNVIYGRAASDMKGAVAAMVMAGAVIKELEIELKGDLKLAAVVQEEVGGTGTVSTIEEKHFLGDLVVVGEATNMDIALGHRGGVGMNVVVRGKSCHASAPEQGINSLYKATNLINRIRSELIPSLPDHPVFGRTTLAVTRIFVKPDADNVVPEECVFYIDCRNGPNFPAVTLKAALEEIISAIKLEDPDFDAFVVPTRLIRGLREFSGFYTEPKEHPIILEAKKAISEVLGREPMLTVWRFATDGRFYSWLGLPVLGFGPGKESYAHTHQDHVRVDDFLDAVKVYSYLACQVCGVK